MINEIKDQINNFSAQNEYYWINELRVSISKFFFSFVEVFNKKLNLENHIESQKVDNNY